MLAPGRIYLDNAATSYPKPPGVAEAMARYAETCGAPARGGSAEARAAAALVRQCRERVCRLIHGAAAERVVFTLNTTDAMNMAIRGVVMHRLRTTEGPVELLTTELDHNSALRPLNALAETFPGRVRCRRLRLDPALHAADPEELRRAVGRETALFVTLHASNVTGAVQPVEAYGAICREAGVPFVLDAAQSLGHVELDVEACGADLVAFAGHKGLLGPTGTGGLYIAPGMDGVMDTVREGGTGWRSEDERMPTALPERFEPGSHNTIGIIGLSEGVRWLLERGSDQVRRHEASLIDRALGPGGLVDAPGLSLIGPAESERRVGVFTFVHESIAPAELARRLEARGIIGRAGLHCAPLAHQRYGTRADPGRAGGMRLSVGPFVTGADLDAAAEALREICREPAAV
ncbi:MAG: aminotransferase class V-fold PLP-dependent enzyme [Phycisphaerae bacterium]|nr:aminotransferase class V-fold PLP-dependent enzyme [Phycisphaerae bacterium]